MMEENDLFRTLREIENYLSIEFQKYVQSPNGVNNPWIQPLTMNWIERSIHTDRFRDIVNRLPYEPLRQMLTSFLVNANNMIEQRLRQYDAEMNNYVNQALQSTASRRDSELQFVFRLQFISESFHDKRLRMDVYREMYEDKYHGHYTLKAWYQRYVQLWNERGKQKHGRDERDKHKDQHKIHIDDGTVPYPFRSKIKQYRKTNPTVNYVETVANDRLKKDDYNRPYYSPYHGSWEIDHCFNMCKQKDSWMFCINVNTRFLVVYQIPERTDTVLASLRNLHSRYLVKSIRGDGSSSYNNGNLANWYQQNHINTYFTGDRFTYHNKAIDVAIKTIRNAIGYRVINPEHLQQLVDYYNDTFHKGIGMTPREMQEHPELESRYIRYCDEKLLQVKQRQHYGGLLKYEKGDILLVHVDLSQTSDRDEKRRRHYDRLAEFVEYVHGNARVILERPVLLAKNHYVNDVVVPVYFTKYVSKNKQSIPTDVVNTYLIRSDTSTV